MLATTLSSTASVNIFAHLDSLISNSSITIRNKEASIAKIVKTLPPKSTLPAVLENEYTINERVYKEYADFQNDSAQKFARRNIDIAQLLNDKEKITQSKLDLMHFLTKVYLLDETAAMAATVDTAGMNQDQLLYYYKIMSDICLFKLEFHKGSVYEKQYQDQLTQYRSKIATLAKPGSERQLLYKANFLNDTGKTQEAIALLEKMLKNYTSGDRTFSVITSTLAFYYSNLGNKQKQKELLAMSAASDIEGCIMENSALRQLAQLLFDEGDIDRAYQYINRSVADANYYGTRLRNVQASQLVPRIINAYQEKQERNYRNMRNMAIGMALLAALLVAGIIAIALLYRRYRRLSESRKIINDKLNQAVNMLEQSNSQLRERDKIKEQYLSRFLTLSSAFIDSNEKQRKSMNRLAMEDKFKELKTILKSPHFYYDNTKLFYENFDSAFLNIYPSFIDEVNNLLLPQEHIATKGDEQLTRELRILALLRLGITDNKEIAGILRSSITTIYTYRSRLKSKAIDKDNFENQVKNIQAS